MSCIHVHTHAWTKKDPKLTHTEASNCKHIKSLTVQITLSSALLTLPASIGACRYVGVLQSWHWAQPGTSDWRAVDPQIGRGLYKHCGWEYCGIEIGNTHSLTYRYSTPSHKAIATPPTQCYWKQEAEKKRVYEEWVREVKRCSHSHHWCLQLKDSCVQEARFWHAEKHDTLHGKTLHLISCRWNFSLLIVITTNFSDLNTPGFGGYFLAISKFCVRQKGGIANCLKIFLIFASTFCDFCIAH